MKFASFLICFFSFATNTSQDGHVEFVCKRKQMSTNRCHYNFKVDGAKFRYVDIGCRFKKTDDVIKKVKSGELALAKNWEIECGGD
jgi:hypothetical protein